jgi:hypothetical protein
MACAHCGRGECDGRCQAAAPPEPRPKADTLPDEDEEEDPPDWADVLLGEKDEDSERPTSP